MTTETASPNAKKETLFKKKHYLMLVIYQVFQLNK